MDYPRFRQLDGSHPFQEAVPGGYIPYRARRRKGVRAVWFNFALAREMGLIPAGHPDRLTRPLHRVLRDTFGLVIVNEYDLAHGPKAPPGDLLPGTYMATRYLQLQHPDRRGTTSGDGRSVWNGTIRHRGKAWDVSSCGTGVTSLCPATATEGRFFQTGSNEASYGCGTATLHEGMETLLMSEAFHRNGLSTERVLAILRDADDFGIVVRVAPNLLRPSHFLAPLKQGHLDRLRAVTDLHIQRQVQNQEFPIIARRPARYRHWARDMARTFGRVTAVLEAEYIFLWLDWDGDNILADGGIIDYGSVRQMGLCHREYRFDDGPRYSTSLTEQRQKARGLVQNFAQIRDYLIQGRKSPLRSFADDPILAIFDDTFRETRLERLLLRVGLTAPVAAQLLSRRRKIVMIFDRIHSSLERARSARGPHPVADGINWNAVFSSRDLLRRLPRRLHQNQKVRACDILEMSYSSYATRKDRRQTQHRLRQASRFLRAYVDLLDAAAAINGQSPQRILAMVQRRSEVINRYARITGDSITHAATSLLKVRPQLTPAAWHRIIENFINDQILVPELRSTRRPAPTPVRGGGRAILDELHELNEMFCHGL
jgi:uncharacterized protein YdiU (UPF0061 family)